MARRRLSPFSLAFLDIMFCGFGAVVLLVLLVNARMVSSRRETHRDLRGEVERLEQEVAAGRGYLVRLQERGQAAEARLDEIRSRSRQVVAEIVRVRRKLAGFDREIRAGRGGIRQLEAELKGLEAERRGLATKIGADREKGRAVLRFEGEGHRQYLTGLRLGGRRVLILVDTSASMLDRSVVNVIRRRNMDREARRNAPKWQRVKKTVAWIVANLSSGVRIQVHAFAEKAKSLDPETPAAWVRVTDRERVAAIMARLDAVVPDGGTSLENGLRVAAALSPRPDNIILLTDGLPTMGAQRSPDRLVPGEKRQRLFVRAVQRLPGRIPVNIILFPMEGDPVAAALYWKLAVQTGGSFFTPTADWP